MFDPAYIYAFPILMDHEGGFQKAENDPGNWTGGRPGRGVLKGTNMGISAAQYPDLDIEHLTEDDVKEIYYKDVWSHQPWLHFHQELAAKLFDCGVDVGQVPVNICLQRALRSLGHPLTEDGILGEKTLEAVQSTDQGTLLLILRSEIAAHYRLVAQHNPTQANDLPGWLNRAYS